jgi:hypothetical protein
LEAATAKYADLATHYDGACAALTTSEEQLARVRNQLHLQTAKSREREIALDVKLAALEEDVQQTSRALTVANRMLQQRNNQVKEQDDKLKALETALEDAQQTAISRKTEAPQTPVSEVAVVSETVGRQSMLKSRPLSCLPSDDESIGELCTAAAVKHRRVASQRFVAPTTSHEDDNLRSASPRGLAIQPRPQAWQASRKSIDVLGKVESLWQELADLNEDDDPVDTVSNLSSVYEPLVDAGETIQEQTSINLPSEEPTPKTESPLKAMISVGTQTESLFASDTAAAVAARFSTASSGLINLERLRADLLDWLGGPDTECPSPRVPQRSESLARSYSIPRSAHSYSMSLPERERSVTNKSVQSLLMTLPPSSDPLPSSNPLVAAARSKASTTARKPQPFFRYLMQPSVKLPVLESMPPSRASSSASSEDIGQVVQSPSASPMTRMVAQCMIGSYMYKTVRKTRAGVFRWRRQPDLEPVRHRRFVALRLSELAVSWSFTRPAVGMQLGIRKFPVDQVLDIEEASTLPEAHHRSLLLFSGDKSIRFTCESREDHNRWLEVLRWLVRRRAQAEEAGEKRQSSAPLSIPQFQPARRHIQATWPQRSVSENLGSCASPPAISMAHRQRSGLDKADDSPRSAFSSMPRSGTQRTPEPVPASVSS